MRPSVIFTKNLMKVNIREAQPKDWRAVQNIGMTVFEANRKYDPVLNMKWPSSEEGVKYYRSAISKKENYVLIAEADSQVVGYLIGGEFSYGYRKVVYGEIKDMGVLPNYRRKGIGTTLVNEFRKWCRTKGYDQLYVNTYYKDRRAVSFYKKQGMVPSDLVLIGKVK